MLLTLHIEAAGPLAFAERKPGIQFRKSLPFIPGATIFGAIGRLLKERGRFDGEQMRGLRCYNAYPALAGDLWVRPLPLTAIQPKGKPKQRRRDTLVERVCWEVQQPAALIFSATSVRGEAWKNAERGFYTLRVHPDARGLYPVEEEQIDSIRDVEQRVLTRVAINRRRGTAEDQRLYSPLVLNEVTSDDEPTRFWGQVDVPNSAEEIHTALNAITHLGGRQSSGLGRVELEMSSTEHETPGEIARRVEALTKRFRDQAALYAELGGRPWEIGQRSIFTLNLTADAILLEHGWLPTTELTAEMLRELTGIEADLLRSFAAPAIGGGWNVLWQQPKPTAVVTTMGSLFVFQAREPLGPDQHAALARLQREGLGERRQEGYGQVRICDDFHLMVNPTSDLEEA